MKYTDFCSQFNMAPSVKSLEADRFLIYFLLCDGAIVYVGKSSENCLYGRLRSHKQDKEFDSFFTIQDVESEDHALQLEKGFISLLRPKFNKAEVRVNMAAIQTVIKLVTLPTFRPTPERLDEADRIVLLKKLTRVQWERAQKSKSEATRLQNKEKAERGIKELERMGYVITEWKDGSITRIKIDIDGGVLMN